MLYGLSYIVFVLSVKRSVLPGRAGAGDIATGFAIGALPVLVWAICLGLHRRRKHEGPPVQLTKPSLISSGATAVIVITTVLAYTFEGVSILLALLLMRFGVVFVAPLLDLATGRSISGASWVSVALCLGATGLGIGLRTFTFVSPLLCLVIAMYMLAYGLRLGLMARFTKSRDRRIRGDWFIIEMTGVAAGACLVLLTALLLRWPVSWTPQAVLAGFGYGAALVYGTLVYLDWSETTRSVVINRATSLIAGCIASLMGALWFGLARPPPAEWLLAGLFALAIAVQAYWRTGDAC